jgi:hypothetical protein
MDAMAIGANIMLVAAAAHPFDSDHPADSRAHE